MKKFYLLLCTTLLFVSSSGIAQTELVKVCYLPFQYETAVAVTPSSIVQERCKTLGQTDSVVSKLSALVSKKPGKWDGRPDFDDLLVRLEIIDGDKPPLFVDKQGIVLVSNERYPLDSATLTDIEGLLDPLFGYPRKE